MWTAPSQRGFVIANRTKMGGPGMKKLLLAGALLLAATAAHAQAFGGGLGSTNSSDWNSRTEQGYTRGNIYIRPYAHSARHLRYHRHHVHRHHRHA